MSIPSNNNEESIIDKSNEHITNMKESIGEINTTLREISSEYISTKMAEAQLENMFKKTTLINNITTSTTMIERLMKEQRELFVNSNPELDRNFEITNKNMMDNLIDKLSTLIDNYKYIDGKYNKETYANYIKTIQNITKYSKTTENITKDSKTTENITKDSTITEKYKTIQEKYKTIQEKHTEYISTINKLIEDIGQTSENNIYDIKTKLFTVTSDNEQQIEEKEKKKEIIKLLENIQKILSIEKEISKINKEILNEEYNIQIVRENYEKLHNKFKELAIKTGKGKNTNKKKHLIKSTKKIKNIIKLFKKYNTTFKTNHTHLIRTNKTKRQYKKQHKRIKTRKNRHKYKYKIGGDYNDIDEKKKLIDKIFESINKCYEGYGGCSMHFIPIRFNIKKQARYGVLDKLGLFIYNGNNIFLSYTKGKFRGITPDITQKTCTDCNLYMNIGEQCHISPELQTITAMDMTNFINSKSIDDIIVKTLNVSSENIGMPTMGDNNEETLYGLLFNEYYRHLSFRDYFVILLKKKNKTIETILNPKEKVNLDNISVDELIEKVDENVNHLINDKN
jgi:hypothetical protein